VALAPQLTISAASVSRYRAPLAKPVTTRAGGSHREGCLLTISLSNSSAAATPAADPSVTAVIATGIGEAAPLPGLSKETTEEAAAQLHLLAGLLRGAALPAALPLLGVGAVSAWMRRGLGVPPEVLLPSVRLALESALFTALAAARGCTLTDLLTNGGSRRRNGDAASSAPTFSARSVHLNGLLSCTDGPPAAAATEAAALVAAGYRALKIKVGRRSSPVDDADTVLAVRAAVGPDIVLRADANRAWSLERALAFGRRAVAAGLQYVEEPTADPLDMGAFFLETGGGWGGLGGVGWGVGVLIALMLLLLTTTTTRELHSPPAVSDKPDTSVLIALV